MAGNARSDLPELGVGIVYTSALEPLLEAHPEVVDVLEIEPQTTWLERLDRPGEILARSEVDEHIANLPYRKLVHSIGTPVGGSVPGIEAQLPLLRASVRKLGAPWASEHLSFNLTPDYFTGFFLPPRQTDAGVQTYISSIRHLAAAVEVPLAIETGVNYLRPRPAEIPDGEFVATLAESAGCGILLDLHNVYANERNGRQKMWAFLRQLPLDRVWEVHVAGGFEWGGYWVDAHSGSLPDDLFALSRDIIPHLPNLKAIIFEVFTSFLPTFGLDSVRAEMDRIRELWQLRRTAVPSSTLARTDARQRCDSPVSVQEWESALGGLAIGRQPATSFATELAADPGIPLMRELIHEFRASMVVAVYRLSCRLMMLALSPDVFRAILEDFWAQEPPKQYAAAEAESFIAYLRSKNMRLPQLAKVLEFEKAAMDTVLDGQPRVVKFASDPFPLLRSLAEGRLPEGIPKEGEYEIELKPEGPVTVAGIDVEQVRGVFPFH